MTVACPRALVRWSPPILGALVLACLGTAPAADAAVTAQVTAGVLAIAMSGADDVAVTCASGSVKVNGANTTPATGCAALSKVTVTGTGAFANTIDVKAVTRALGFSGLPLRLNDINNPLAADNTAVTVDGGAGDDAIVTSDDATIEGLVTGGAGSDTVTIATGAPRLFFANAASPEVDTITGAVPPLVYHLDFSASTNGVTIDLNGGLGGDALAIASQTNRVVKIGSAELGGDVARIDGSAVADSITTHATHGSFVDGHQGADTLIGGAGDDFYLLGESSGVDTLTDPVGINRLGFCNMEPGHGLHVDLTGGLGGGLIATTADAVMTLQLADPADTATLSSFFQIQSSQGDDDITGNDSDNAFDDCGGNDVIRGRGGNDVFDETFTVLAVATSGNDRYEGGDGNDLYKFSCSSAGGQETDTVVELPGGGTDTLNLLDTEKCGASETLTADLRSDAPLVRIGPSGGAARKVIQTGAAGQAANFDNVRSPGAGDRVIGNGADNLLISPGLLSGGPGNDTFQGGSVTYVLSPAPVLVDLPNGVATGEGSDHFVVSLREVFGSPFDDTMIGLSAQPAIALHGEGGNDTLFIGTFGIGNGGEGNDVLTGGNIGTLNGDGGNDTITVSLQGVGNGGEGNDTITVLGGATANAGNGEDTLIAFNFNNTLNGEGGNDTFLNPAAQPQPLGVGIPTPNVINGGEGNDTIDARNEWPDVVNCGNGVDVVLSDDSGETIDGACDSVNPEGPKPPPDTTDLALLTCGAADLRFLGASADANRVFFATTTSFSSADTDGVVDIYERTPEALRLVSAGSAPVAVEIAQITANGIVFFQTTEAIPGTGDVDTARDIYRYEDGVLTLASAGTANATASFFGTSPDGNRVFFSTDEALLPADTDAGADLYERDHGTVKLVSGPVVTGAPPTISSAIFFGISADGTHAYFSSTERLAPEDTRDNSFDLYQRVGDTVTLLSTGFTGNLPFFGAGIGAFFIGSSADGSRVYFSTDLSLTPDDPDGTGTGEDIYQNDAGTVTRIVSGSAAFSVSADGTRLVLGTTEKLAPTDTDGSFDLYQWNGTSFTLLTGGTEEVEARFLAAAADATRVFFSTVEALLPADVDRTLDVYEWQNGVISLVTPGMADVSAGFRGVTADGAHLFFATAEALVPADVDTGIDVYERTSGGVALVGAGTANTTTRFGGVSSDAAVLIFATNEGLLTSDADGLGDLYAFGPSGFPIEPICEEILVEDCGNCVDDDGDLQIDRADDDCPAPTNGAGAGLTDLKGQAKPAAKCQQALGKAGSKLASQRVKRLQKCLTKTFACVQLKPGDAKCVAKSGVTCTKLLAGVTADRAKLTKSIGKKCGTPPLAFADLTALAGVGFGAEEAAFCSRQGVPALDSVAAVTECVRRVHECRADAIVGQQVPRARELLTAAGQNAAGAAPCLPIGADGGGIGLDDPKGAGKAVTKCQLALQKAAVKLVAQEQKLAQKCSDAVTKCLQLKPDDAKCPPKAQATCTKLLAKLTLAGTGVEAKLTAALAKSCAGPAFDQSTLFASTGIGFQAHAAECAGLGVTALASTADVATCVIRLHECRAEQLLTSEIPRLHELLAIGGTALP